MLQWIRRHCRWHGPALSGYGVHLVFVHDLQRAPPPVYADVRQSVLENWRADQQEQFNAAFFESLKNRYDIVIAEPPYGLDRDRDRQANTGREEDTAPAEVEFAATTDPAS